MTDGPLVVVGYSADSVEAVATLMASIGSDFPAPFVVAPHLEPNPPSRLAPILAPRTSARVVEVDRRVALQNGTIYVAPPNRQVLILDRHVAPDHDEAERPRPSMDVLLARAAASCGPRLVAVLLAGSGNDGAAGVLEVKEAGGVVIVQDLAAAAPASLPQALSPSAIDHVAELAEIPGLIRRVLEGEPAWLPEAESDPVFGDVLALVSGRWGIDFSSYKPATLVRRVARRMARRHVEDMRDYLSLLEEDDAELHDLVKSLIIKVTEFFRDQEAFAYLRSHILPSVLEGARARGQVLRLWSAGCSTGEEAYSLSMVVADLLGAELPRWAIKVFATDIDEKAITYARRGLYAETALRNLPAGYREAYFAAETGGHRLAKPIRQMVIFGQQDLTRAVPFPNIDLVVCRNLLIYLKPDLQSAMMDLFAYSLARAQGYLFLGRAETARPSRARFAVVDKKWKVYRCLSAAPLGITSRGAALALLPPATAVAESRSADHAPADAELRLLRRVAEQVLLAFGSGAVIVDRAYRIVAANVPARRLLGMVEARPDQDFLHAARGLPYAELRGAIDGAFRNRAPVALQHVALEGVAESPARHLGFTLTPLQLSGVEDYLVITVHDVSAAVEAQRADAQLQARQEQLIEQLEATSNRLGKVNTALQSTNEQLQAANEEMLLTQEELQATNEEFEATNEELQSTNEELETSNEELQATNEELETTNDELTARSSELLELNQAVRTERRRLDEMVALAPFHMVLLEGATLRVSVLNAHSARLFGSSESETGRTLEELCADPGLWPLLEGARQVLRNDAEWRSPALHVAAWGERRLTVTVVPTHDAQGRISGAVLYAEEVPGRPPTP